MKLEVTCSSFVAAVLVLLIALPIPALASDDSTATESEELRMVLHLGHLNRDNRPDTIFGGSRKNLDVVPVRIAWGVDSGEVARTTRIKLPNWKRWRLSFAVEDMNGDTTADLVFFLHGKVRVQGVDRDTIRSLVVFGQYGLDTVTQVNLNAITRGMQTGPFIAMDLVRGEHLRNRARRDLTGFSSYVLRRPQFSTGSDSTGRPTPGATESPIVAIYPNPTGQTATVEASQLPESRYRVMLISVNGTRYADLDVEVGPQRSLLQSISVLDVPSGYYFVRVLASGVLVGDYPVVVLH